jgi:hypothetical protein
MKCFREEKLQAKQLTLDAFFKMADNSTKDEPQPGPSYCM